MKPEKPVNYTMTPNRVYDELMSEMGFGEFKVVSVIIRKTIGFHRVSAEISIAEFMRMTKMSSQGVIDAVGEAMNRGVVWRKPARNNGFSYGLDLDYSDEMPEPKPLAVKAASSQASGEQALNVVDYRSQASRELALKLVESLTPVLKKEERKEYKEKGKESAAAPPPPSYITFGNQEQVPQYRNRTKQFLDNIGQQREQLGLDAPQFTALVNSVLENMNATSIAAQDTDYGANELKDAQQAALALAGLGHKTAEAVGVIFSTWYTHDFRGVKGSPPATYKQVVEHARGMEKIVRNRASAAPAMTADQKATIRTRAQMARQSLATAKKFGGAIRPEWQRDINAAQQAGL